MVCVGAGTETQPTGLQSCLPGWVCPGHGVPHAAAQPEPEGRLPVSGLAQTDAS